ncbi:MAG: hypothetical protein ACOC5J_01525 [Gemmatimonadota bacterium]
MNQGARDDTDWSRVDLEALRQHLADVEEIRALGYIGLMATGVHHTEHHWMIATGRQPHEH